MGEARMQSAPAIRQTESGQGHEGLLGRISSGISGNAIALHRLDMERAGERTQAIHLLQGMLTDMKERVARRASGKARLACAETGLELTYKAS
jgi:hypothetical protein